MNFKELRTLLRSDLQRLSVPIQGATESRVHWLGVLNPRFIPVLIVRLARYFFLSRLLRPFSHLFTWLNVIVFGIEFTPKCEVGEGLLLPHTVGTVIGALKIGRNVTIFQGCGCKGTWRYCDWRWCRHCSKFVGGRECASWGHDDWGASSLERAEMTTTYLRGKQILFFGPSTFNYEKEIVAELEKAGAQVTYRSDKPGNSFLLKALLRLFPKILWRYADFVFRRWLSENGPSTCDVVLVVKGEGLSPKFLDILRVKYKDAKFILYLWDSVRNVRKVELKLIKFDALYSFDAGDCKKHSLLKYRPLFFLERYLDKNPSIGRECFFIGTLNGDRPAVIERLLHALPPHTFDYWLFVRGSIELGIRRIFDRSLKGLDHARFLRQPMSSLEISQHFKACAAIVDIEHPNQVGLTMRTFEVLASGKKLITTNKSILNHDFYDASRICVVDRNNPQIEASFIETKVAQLPNSFYEKYSLKGWLSEVLECIAPIDGNLKR
jgi:hypothetical protein